MDSFFLRFFATLGIFTVEPVVVNPPSTLPDLIGIGSTVFSALALTVALKSLDLSLNILYKLILPEI